MLIHLLLALAPQLPARAEGQRPAALYQNPLEAARAERARRRAPPRSIVDTAPPGPDLGLTQVGSLLPGSSSVFFGSSYSITQASTPQGGASGGASVIYYIVKMNPGTGFKEKFLVHAPPFQIGPRPMLVIFHKYGTSYLDALVNTNFLLEAKARQWNLVCPLGASGVHFSSIESQINTEAALDWMLTHTNVDRDRIYGIGFSMGGGAVANYAARHLDPTHAMFAAIIDHSGGVALKDTYFRDPPTNYILDFWFGDGSAGSAEPWQMARSSVVNFDPYTYEVETAEDLARNLIHMNVRVMRASNDPLAYLSQQSEVFDDQMRARGALAGSMYGYYVLPGNLHTWDLLDETTACQWLDSKSLTMPTSGNTLADHDGPYFHFTVEQDLGGAFTPFVWSIDSGLNKLTLSNTQNLKRLTLDTLDAGLDPGAALTVSINTTDALPNEVRLLDYASAPSLVLRNGVTASAIWTATPPSGNLLLQELQTGAQIWQIFP